MTDEEGRAVGQVKSGFVWMYYSKDLLKLNDDALSFLEKVVTGKINKKMKDHRSVVGLERPSYKMIVHAGKKTLLIWLTRCDVAVVELKAIVEGANVFTIDANSISECYEHGESIKLLFGFEVLKGE